MNNFFAAFTTVKTKNVEKNVDNAFRFVSNTVDLNLFIQCE